MRSLRDSTDAVPKDLVEEKKFPGFYLLSPLPSVAVVSHRFFHSGCPPTRIDCQRPLRWCVDVSQSEKRSKASGCTLRMSHIWLRTEIPTVPSTEQWPVIDRDSVTFFLSMLSFQHA